MSHYNFWHKIKCSFFIILAGLVLAVVLGGILEYCNIPSFNVKTNYISYFHNNYIFQLLQSKRMRHWSRIYKLQNKIITLQPKLKKYSLDYWYSTIIAKYCPEKLDNIIIAIIFAESSFNNFKINQNRDYGLGQINYNVWGKYFNISKKELLNPIINIQIIVKILVNLKKQYHDKYWWGYYHSKTIKSRNRYINKINKILNKLNKVAANESYEKY